MGAKDDFMISADRFSFPEKEYHNPVRRMTGTGLSCLFPKEAQTGLNTWVPMVRLLEILNCNPASKVPVTPEPNP